MAELETPDELESIYLARFDEVSEHRPLFTGDVYRMSDGHLVMVLQHPCALRRGVDLYPKTLVAPVQPDTLRSDWAKAAYTKMPLPRLIDGKDHSADFVTPELPDSPTLVASERIAVMSQSGVNLLMQRWSHHSTRLVVPTHLYSDVALGPFDEADLLEEWTQDRVESGSTSTAAEHECSAWLDKKENGKIRRAMLSDPQYASAVRRDARQYRKSEKLAVE
ncbi:hypothetical protein [Mycobacterium sp. 236(2023)]|uniref:hypothetical protein n=1 Tax=Mycobacterium sp. 236(2023) TaxID=3038163 RepID=UPI0024155F99|nr:hypothetical protein [Mycobacterium sp. 236(2023)]MDG4666062.1 hypothetical protein [Mycobacterium sp. 236(2023)]